MAALAWAARLVLAGVLVAAAAAKFRNRRSLPSQLEGLGVPPTLVPAVARALPLAELVVAVGLVLAPTSAAPAWIAVALLGAFSVFVAVTLNRGVRAPCACFGGVSDAPITAGTLVRNAWLVALAVVATGSTTDAGLAGVIVLTAVLGAATVVVLRKIG